MTATTDAKAVKVSLSIRNWAGIIAVAASVIAACGGWCQSVKYDLKDLAAKIESESDNRRENVRELKDVDRQILELIDRLRDKDNAKLDTVLTQLHAVAVDIATLKGKQEGR